MLFTYIFVISFRTCYGLLATYRHLGLGKYPSSVYFNTALMLPMFLDYGDLVGRKQPNSVRYATLTSALMLLQDILLDDENIDVDELKSLFDAEADFTPKTQLQQDTRDMYMKLHESLPEKQLALLNRLNMAQITEDYKNKGLWFPALVYSFNPNMSESECELLGRMGFWIKCIDDLVDYEEDAANQNSNIFVDVDIDSPPKQYLDQLRRDIFQNMMKLKYPQTEMSLFLYRISVATYAFKLHNEQLQSLPKWWDRLCKSYQPILFVNLILACVVHVRKLFKIRPVDSASKPSDKGIIVKEES